MTEEAAHKAAKALALGMGIPFYVVRGRDGQIMAVQVPSDDCAILATIKPPEIVPCFDSKNAR